ncbi:MULTISPECIES: GNAT family N-acetyltransferase [Flavobacteriaceae]|uniref:GNAT family N-acetyltransferase n=1 Tax=Flavobacteriaceae TaxID=49546 RepID=UPI001491D47A|nr:MULTISPECIES: GNAT family N-acetyltransferase [Allomuricauda]MDC6364616.1 GNAT family N-acetyltransferase [Muricauda sp. AC10]
MFDIRFLKQEEKDSIVPFLKKLDPTITEETLQERLTMMFQNGYQCVGVFDGNKLIGISGLWVLTKYYIGKHVEPDNVYISNAYQGQGIGNLMMEWIFNYAKSIGCNGTELNCYVDNKAGRRFWEKQGYKLVGYHYQKKF